METFTEIKKFVDNPLYQAQRRTCLSHLSGEMIDLPIIGLINGLNRLSYCFTLQSCYGHFVYDGQEDPHNCDPLPFSDAISKVEYRIAYIAIGIENSAPGSVLRDALKEITAMDPQYIQFCCAEWFWKRQVNSYALQVEPDRFKRMDKAYLGYNEALHIEKTRNAVYDHLDKMLLNLQAQDKSDRM